MEVQSVALFLNTLLLGQRSRPSAFAGSSVLRESPLKDKLAPFETIRGRGHSVRPLLGRAPRIYEPPKESAHFLLKFAWLWQHQPLEINPAHRSAA